MKTKILFLNLLLSLSLVSISNSQEKINSDKAQCIHCKMDINDIRFSGQAISMKGEVVHFDAVECLVNFVKIKRTSTFKELLVADYLNPTVFIDAKEASYLISNQIKSPMGANLSAYSSQEEAKRLQKEKGGKIYDWDSLQQKLANSYGTHAHEGHDHYRPDAYAPVGIMGDHLHAKGGLMVSMRTVYMTMDGNRRGTETIDDATIFSNYMVVPQNMDMQMHMVSVMYAPTDKLTLMLMQNIVDKRMDLKARMMMSEKIMFRDFSTSSSDFGDMKLSAMYGIFKNDKSSMHLNGGINIPLGAIQQRDDTPMMENVKLPYPMQLGSGTIDATFGGTYRGNTTSLSWGVQPLITLRTGKNSEEYRFGDQYQINLWGAYKVSNNISFSTRLLGVAEGKIDGVDAQLNPMMVVTANTANSGYDKIKAYLGTNISFMQNSALKRFRLGIEAGIPLYQDFNGIQMSEEFGINIGLLYNIL